jgi:hypothetical protein
MIGFAKPEPQFSLIEQKHRVADSYVEIGTRRSSSIERRLSGRASMANRGVMCPFCLASMGMIVASATSAGGLTALSVILCRKKNRAKELIHNLNERSCQNAKSRNR